MHLVLLQGTPPPVSAYLLCYFPLALVILSLITWFVVTDRHASRPYLRFNPFVAASTPPAELEQRPPAIGETPAGSLGGAPAGTTTVSLGEHGAIAAVPPEDVPPPQAAPDHKPPFSGTQTPAAPSDLGMLSKPAQDALDVSAHAPDAPAVREGLAADAPAAQGAAISHIEYDPAGDDLQGEYVTIANNTASPIDMTGWTLTDEGAHHSYTFPSFVLAAGAEVRLWSRAGSDDAANLYWGNSRAVWNNTHDAAVLADASGNVISRYSYGE